MKKKLLPGSLAAVVIVLVVRGQTKAPTPAANPREIIDTYCLDCTTTA